GSTRCGLHKYRIIRVESEGTKEGYSAHATRSFACPARTLNSAASPIRSSPTRVQYHTRIFPPRGSIHPRLLTAQTHTKVQYENKPDQVPRRPSLPSLSANPVSRMLKIDQAIAMFSCLRFQTAALRIARRRPPTTSIRGFHASPGTYIGVGDLVPNIQLREDTPAKKVSIAEETKGKRKALILGVPGAFSPACSAAHIAKYIEAKVDVPTYVVSVNDPFVTK
ncbi:unnamed protein product, partial [Tuber aestivum]